MHGRIFVKTLRMVGEEDENSLRRGAAGWTPPSFRSDVHDASTQGPEH